MRDMSATDLLSAWERAIGQAPVGQALALLSTAHPERAPDELAALTIGQRNALLLDLRERWFGAWLTSVTTCPRCEHALELRVPVSELRAASAPWSGSGGQPPGIFVEAHGYRVECRLPNSLDLAALESADDPARAEADLLHRCIGSVAREPDERPGGIDVDPSTLPAAVVEALAERLSAADPQADTLLALDCPECAHTWQAPFDIASYLFAEVHAWARRLLCDVHDLARAYGWSEADILAMAPVRRRAYLDLLGMA